MAYKSSWLSFPCNTPLTTLTCIQLPQQTRVLADLHLAGRTAWQVGVLLSSWIAGILCLLAQGWFCLFVWFDEKNTFIQGLSYEVKLNYVL